jgi:hypothetical protein
MTLARGDYPTWQYKLDRREKVLFPNGSEAQIVFRNSFDQVIATWTGEVVGDTVVFEDVSGDEIPRGTMYTLTIEDVDGYPRQRRWGDVARSEARFPDHPDNSTQFETVQYSYSFGTTGWLVDPAWRIMNGHPRVYSNGSLPNAVAAGSIVGGDLTFYDDVAMLYYAPVKTDAVRLTYNVVKNTFGDAWIVICSDYSMKNYACIRHHEQSGSGDYVSIATGSGPVTITNRAQLTRTTQDLENFTAEYNPASNTYAVYLGTSKEPLVSWTDGTNIVNHGAGERYVGMGFKSGLLSPGVMVSDFWIGDTL